MTNPGLRDSDIKYLRALYMSPDPVVTSSEVAKDAGVSQQAAYSKLNDLEERGLVMSKKSGSRSRVWWLTTEGRQAYAESEL
ncbi:helix-turn-helix domain-containing protein [Halobaculum gomorrense]|uniref:Sugar-specific transcriptional regulator TrmB n=1 Tax=Halobaculum gomorrense TaxID=43928 RepID=A0A1M5JC51_9EURY|nr:Sugar-specific transcriptional regulator TrmB [Halobaculum gomorrense]